MVNKSPSVRPVLALAPPDLLTVLTYQWLSVGVWGRPPPVDSAPLTNEFGIAGQHGQQHARGGGAATAVVAPVNRGPSMDRHTQQQRAGPRAL